MTCAEHCTTNSVSLLGVPLSPAEVCGVERQVTRALGPAIAVAREHVRSQPVNVDETSWRERSKKGAAP